MNHVPGSFLWVAAVLVAVLSVARTARLLVFDEFPPVAWLRAQVVARLPESWAPLATCAFCIAPYLAAGMGVWMWLAWTGTNFHWTWWVLNGWWAACYLAAIVVAYDQPE